MFALGIGQADLTLHCFPSLPTQNHSLSGQARFRVQQLINNTVVFFPAALVHFGIFINVEPGKLNQGLGFQFLAFYEGFLILFLLRRILAIDPIQERLPRFCRVF
jgi:hypothetical protein